MTFYRRAFFCRFIGFALLIAAIVFGSSTPNAWAGRGRQVVRVMTQNMDAGTDLLFYFVTDPVTATELTYQELLATDFTGRAGLLADEIAVQRPYLISLQEVTLWQTISPTGAVDTLADQLDLLLDALAAKNQHYEVVAGQDLTDITAPLGEGGLRFLDRNVILARTNLKKSELALSNVQHGIYKAKIAPVPGFPPELNGWLSVDAKIGDERLRFFCTHLETAVSETDDTQIRQGLELIKIMRKSKIPVILAGDFNSDASGLGVGPDLTPTAGIIVDAGYSDTWRMFHNPATGLTWPLYLEDIYAGPSYATERIDLIFSRDIGILNVHIIGTDYPFPSDHAGVVATLDTDKSCNDEGGDRDKDRDRNRDRD